MQDFRPLKKDELEDCILTKEPSLSYFTRSWKKFKKNGPALCACAFLLLLFIMALIGPLFSPYTYYDIHLPLKNSPPNSQFWFGTDELGRDIFCRIWWGARISLTVGILASLIDMCVGVCYGAFVAFKGGLLEEILMRVADIAHSIPYLLIVILLTVLIGSGIHTILIALTVTGWIPMARIVRGQVLQIKQMDYMTAARALGASSKRLMFYHLIPNCLASIVTTVTFTIPSAIFAESFLSFLGLGIQSPVASWGTMASDGLPALTYFPWRLLFPAIFISLTMLSFNLIGDGLRDAFDPKLK